MEGKKKMKWFSTVLLCFSILFTYTFGAMLPHVAADDFEASLLNFPESYRSGLRALHEKYPNWKFVADNIPLDWENVVAAQCVVGKNLVSTNIASWKSCEYGAYNLENKTWTVFDGSSWVSASKELITYYLDPRSYLSESNIFTFMKQGYDANLHTLEGIKNIVRGTFLDNLFPEDPGKTYSDIILMAAEQSKVSPYVLASMIRQEQGVQGSSGSISGTYQGYEGYYNFFNVGAYATGTMTAIERGLWYASGLGIGQTTNNRPWNSREKSIIGGAISYGNTYVSYGQDNFYYKKFNVISTKYPVHTHQYMTNIQGAESEGVILKRAYADILNTELIFNIPVYNNMLSSASIKPTSTGNNNNLLSSLTVNGFTINSTFDTYSYNYELFVNKDTFNIQINAVPFDSGASVITPLNLNLVDGNNSVPVTVKAPSGTTRTYYLNIYKPTNADTPTLTSSEYTIGDFISNVPPDTSTANFLNKITISNCSANILDASGKTKTGIIATEDKLQLVQNNAVYKTYEISVNGDLNGDGKLTSFDLLKIQRHILNFSTLSGIYLSSADYSRDGKITSFDLLKVQKYILKI